jgi:diacylglycerol kinase family enzyme
MRVPQGPQWRAEGFAAAVAAGGDGTVGAVASHVAQTEMPLGILPLGTSNDVARSLGIPLKLDEACTVVAHGTVGEMDIGQAVPAATEPGAPDIIAEAAAHGGETLEVAQREAVAQLGAYFLHTLTLGLNVEFARLATDAARRERWGPLTYAAAAIEALGRLRTLPIVVRLEGVASSAYGMRVPPTPEKKGRQGLRVVDEDSTRVIMGDMVQLAAIVTPVFGGGANLRVPNVSLSDRLLDFIVIEALAARHLRTLIERLSAGPPWPRAVGQNSQEPQELELPGLWRFKAQAAMIEHPADADVTLDGEIRGRTPLGVRVVPGGLRVLVAQERAEEVLGG